MLDYESVAKALAAYEPELLPRQDLRCAAVLLPLFRKQGRDYLIFTLRTHRVRHHRGEISFPGGGCEPADADLLDTALRETQEELGIDPESVRVLGRLDDFSSIHGYHVTPFVGVIPWPCDLRPDPGEIAELIELPLDRLREPSIFSTEDWTHRGRTHPVHFFRIDGYEIWGLTAAMLRQFFQRTPL